MPNPSQILQRPQQLFDWIVMFIATGCYSGYARIVSHTRTHSDLRTLAVEDANEELIGSKKIIEDKVGCAVSTLAYPYGGYDNCVKSLVENHFSLACSVDLGFFNRYSDPFALKRIDMYYLQRLALFRRLFSPGVSAYFGLRRYLRDLRRQTPHWLNRL